MGDKLSCDQVIEEDKLQENSKKVGEVFLRELLKLRDEFEIVGDVRGKGLMLGVEFIKNKVQCECCVYVCDVCVVSAVCLCVCVSAVCVLCVCKYCVCMCECCVYV